MILKIIAAELDAIAIGSAYAVLKNGFPEMFCCRGLLL